MDKSFESFETIGILRIFHNKLWEMWKERIKCDKEQEKEEVCEASVGRE